MIGWIKIHRKLLEWEWYDEPNTFRLFIHLLIKANRTKKKYRGEIINIGCIMTGQDLLSIELKLSRQKIRTALNNLKSTNEITIKTTTKGSVIQLVKYKSYQLSTNGLTADLTIEQPKLNQSLTTNKKYKKLDNHKKRIIDEWFLYRKQIKKPIKIEKTIDKLLDKFIKCDYENIKLVVNASIENNWQGLFWDKQQIQKEKNIPKKEKVNAALLIHQKRGYDKV